MALTTNEDWLDALADALGLTDGAKTAFIEALTAPTNAWARGGLSVLYSAAKSVEAVETLNQFLRDAVDWYAGEVDGGPSEDGYFVVRDSAGNAYLLPSPARLMADLTGVVPQGALDDVGEAPPRRWYNFCCGPQLSADASEVAVEKTQSHPALNI